MIFAHAFTRGRQLITMTIALVFSFMILIQSPQASAVFTGCLAGEIVGIASTPSGYGYWMVGADGGVFAFGDAQFKGSMAGRPMNKPVVDIIPTATGWGYWLVGEDGGLFAFGDAQPVANNPLPISQHQPIVGGIRQGTTGVVLTATDGGAFALGGARFFGSMGGRPLAKPVVDIVATASNNGYWLIGADGGIFNFGDALLPSWNPLPGMSLAKPIVSAARAGNTMGLWLVGGDGGIFALNNAPYKGGANNIALAKPVSGIASTPSGSGYWLTARDGGLFAYPQDGSGAGFFGSMVTTNPNCAPIGAPSGISATIVQIATDIQNGRAVDPWGGGAVPYVWGGGHGRDVGPSTGTCSGYTGSIQPCPARTTVGVDCSGFTRWVYKLAYGKDIFGGVNTNGQIARLVKVSAANARAGDLVFFGTSSSNTHHVGVYIGNNKMINAPKTGFNIRTDTLHSDLVGYYRYQ